MSTTEQSPADYYRRKQEEADNLLEELKHLRGNIHIAKVTGRRRAKVSLLIADAERLVKLLERQLEQARYVGD